VVGVEVGVVGVVILPFLPPFTTTFSINHDYLPHKL
jgi:hypothetical protein